MNRRAWLFAAAAALAAPSFGQLNRKAARTLGVTIPPTLLARAGRVIG